MAGKRARAYVKAINATLFFSSATYNINECNEGFTTVVPPSDVFEEGVSEWQFSLVGQFIGSAPNFGSLQKLVEIMWGKSIAKVSIDGSKLYVFLFANGASRDWVLENGPWHIQHKPLVLRKWEPNLKRLDFNLERMPVWVQLYNIPLELYSKKGLSYVVSALGVPLYMDSITASKERLEFAKVCVEVEAGVRLPRSIAIKLRDGIVCSVIVVIPWFPSWCSKCKIFGHSDKICTVGAELKASMEKEIGGLSSVVVKDVLGTDPVGGMDTAVVSLKGQSASGQKLKAVEEDMVTGSVGRVVSKGDTSLPLDPTSHVEFEVLGSLVEEDEGRKPRLASQGVANILLEMKNKKKDHLEKTKKLGEQVGETRIKEIRALDMVAQFDKDWSYCWNYSCLDNGRIWILWRKNLLFSVLKVADQSVTVQGCLGGRNVVISAVYGSNIGASRKELWNQLVEIAGGDFNVIAKDEESSNYVDGHLTSEMEDLRNCMDNLGLEEHPFFGPTFTWSNKHEEGFLDRKLDRVLVNDKWCEAFPNSHVEFQAPGVSDHCLAVTWYFHEGLASRQKPFKYFNFWALHPEFKVVVGKSWTEAVQGDPMQALFYKMKRLKPVLKAFNRKCYSNISEKVAEKREHLEKQQVVVLNGGSLDDVVVEKKLHQELVELKKAEMIFYQQKAKVDWLLDGDQCTKFFHAQVAVKRKRNTIRVMVDERGNKLETFEAMAEELVSHFTMQISSIDDNVQGCSDIFLRDLLGFTLLEGADTNLVKAVSNDEIKVVIWNQGKDKAPGPDGFTAAIALVPKQPNSCKAVDFRPISCCSAFYKTVTKILELVMGYGRNFISPRCAIKADLQKAFDSISWKFLLAILKGLGLPKQFISWIVACVMDSRFSIVLNGSLVGFFKGGRGVRQGDPMSPYLFVIAMNILSKLLGIAASEKIFQFHSKCRKVNLTHLCFADDLLIFCKASLDSNVRVKCVLERFYEISGLRLNASKTEIFIDGVNGNQKALVHEVTGFKIGCLPVRYLGVPLVPRKLTEKDCVNLLILPAAVVKRVDQLCARFFWKGGDVPAKGARVKEILVAEGSLWVAWVRTYVLKGADFWSMECKASFSWSLRKILKAREEVYPLFVGITDWDKVNARWLWQGLRGRKEKVGWQKIIWFPMHIPKHSLIAWMAVLDRLPTADRPFGKGLCGCVALIELWEIRRRNWTGRYLDSELGGLALPRRLSLVWMSVFGCSSEFLLLLG
ncbi:uncharacterized protein LOC120179498 [Hibiscus syriacus]|uniref:uncharacterized protein LOC120179498 n=1 Tax=Hibiscus syriacus TaxID=106335 RepID=UPI00192059ED|nr:uncharacterized protein LOC120179498 [Hibiscus syriacus]